MKVTCGLLVFLVSCAVARGFPSATTAHGDNAEEHSMLVNVHGSRPSAPSVDVQMDAFQMFPAKKHAKIESANTVQPVQEQVAPVERAPQAKTIVHAINNHHQEIAKSLKAAHRAYKEQMLSKARLDVAAHLQINKETDTVAPSSSSSSSAPVEIPVTSLQASEEVAKASQSSTAQLSESTAPASISTSAPENMENAVALSEEQIQKMTEEQLRKALIEQIQSSQQQQQQLQQKKQQEEQQQQQEQPQRHHNTRITHRTPVHKHEFTVSMPKTLMSQTGEDFPAKGADVQVALPTPDPRCAPVEICTGGRNVAYSNGVPDLDTVSNTVAEKGMCYKWCPVGCSCC